MQLHHTSLVIAGLVLLSPTADDCGQPTDPVELIECTEQSKTFFAWDLSVMPPATIEVPATCILTGPESYLYVADDQWGETVDWDIAYSFMEAMEVTSFEGAIDPTVGMIANNHTVFGEFPDELDDDPRIYFLLMEMEPFTASDGDTFYFDGYFNAYDQLSDEVVSTVSQGFYRSNEVEMLYLNSAIRPADDPYTLAVAAHEMQHLIHWNYDDYEHIWVGESLAEVAMLINGLYTDEPWVQHYAANPYYPLVNNTSSGSYGSYLLFGMYMYEQLGEDFMLALEIEPTDGITGIDRALARQGYQIPFSGLFANWVVANALNDPTLDGGQYGYSFTDELPRMAREGRLTSRGDAVSASLRAYGVAYVDVAPIRAGSLEVTADRPDTLLTLLIDADSAGEVNVWPIPPDGAGGYTYAVLPDHTYTLVLSHTDEDEIDTGVENGFSVELQ